MLCLLYSNFSKAAYITYTGSTDLCFANPSLNLYAMPANAISYDWYFEDVYGHLNHLTSVTGNYFSAVRTGYYYCIVTDSSGSSTTNTVMIRQTWVGEFVWDSQDYRYKCDHIELHVNTSTIAFSSYQWTRNGQIIPGATLPNYYATIGGFYNCWVGNTCGADTNTYGLNIPYVLQTLPSTLALTSSVGDTLCSGTQFTLSLPSFFGATYTWVTMLNNGYFILNANSPDNSYTSTSGAQGYRVYRCDVSNACSYRTTPLDTIWSTGSTTSVSVQSTANAFCAGDSVKLSAVSPNTGMHYQWKESGVDIPGKTSKDLNVLSAGDYSVFVTNGGTCSATSANQVITRYSNPSAKISTQGSTTFCSGDSVLLTGNSGSTLSYQWTKNQIAIPGANSLNYTAKTAGNYRLEVTNSHGCHRTSSVKKILVNSLPTASISALGSTSFCQGGSVILQGPSTSGLSYQWKKNGVALASANTNQYLASTAGYYRCLVTNVNGCSKLSNSINVTVPCRSEEMLSSSSQLYAYPNPSSTGFKISLNEISASEITTQLFDIAGRSIKFDFNIDENNDLEIGKLPAGIYQLVIRSGDESSVVSLVALD
jgi:hypothetical protein